MACYEEWIKRAKSSLELAQAKVIQYTYYEDLCFQSQYPGEYDDVTKEEYEKSVEIAKACLYWVEKIIESGKTDGK